MAIVGRAGEEIARNLTRRKFLNHAAMLAFGFATAAAFEIGRPTTAKAYSCANRTGLCGCNPPGTRYCTAWSSSYCSGSNCAGPCSFTSAYGWGDACWCTADCCYGGGRYSGYYECCDCSCPQGDCGCNAFVTTCVASTPAVAGTSKSGGLAPNWIPCC